MTSDVKLREQLKSASPDKLPQSTFPLYKTVYSQGFLVGFFQCKRKLRNVVSCFIRNILLTGGVWINVSFS